MRRSQSEEGLSILRKAESHVLSCVFCVKVDRECQNRCTSAPQPFANSAPLPWHANQRDITACVLFLSLSPSFSVDRSALTVFLSPLHFLPVQMGCVAQMWPLSFHLTCWCVMFELKSWNRQSLNSVPPPESFCSSYSIQQMLDTL